MSVSGRLLGLALGGLLSAGVAWTDDPGGPIKIGLLVDMSGPLSLETGKGDELGARMAIEEVGGSVLGRPIMLLTADHQNKPDVGLTIAREWVDRDGVRVITGLDNSAISLAVQGMTRDRGVIALIAGAGSSDLTGKGCTARSFHWTHDTYSNAAALVTAGGSGGGDRWFFLTADYALGLAQERDMAEMVRRRRGTVVGTCSMGPASNPRAVVSPGLKVHGIDGLRVVDASVMPLLPSANTMAASLMVGEKAADMIRERAAA